MTERQTQMLNLFLDGYEAKITSKTWATLAKCSKDTAIRDIQDLVEKNILIEDIPGAKRPSYSIVYDSEDLTQFFSDVSIVEENGIPYLKALYKGKRPINVLKDTRKAIYLCPICSVNTARISPADTRTFLCE